MLLVMNIVVSPDNEKLNNCADFFWLIPRDRTFPPKWDSALLGGSVLGGPCRELPSKQSQGMELFQWLSFLPFCIYKGGGFHCHRPWEASGH